MPPHFLNSFQEYKKIIRLWKDSKTCFSISILNKMVFPKSIKIIQFKFFIDCFYVGFQFVCTTFILRSILEVCNLALCLFLTYEIAHVRIIDCCMHWK